MKINEQIKQEYTSRFNGAARPLTGTTGPTRPLQLPRLSSKLHRGSEWEAADRRALVLSAWCEGFGLMSLPVRNLKCLSPVMCQCKVICSNRTLSLMFGCKVRLLQQQRLSSGCTLFRHRTKPSKRPLGEISFLSFFLNYFFYFFRGGGLKAIWTALFFPFQVQIHDSN